MEQGGGQAVGEELVVGRREGLEHQGPAGGVDAHRVAVDGVDEGLVEGDPGRDAVPQAVGDDRGILGEPVRGVPVQPAAGVLQVLREVPVEEGGQRGDAHCQQVVHQPVVEGESGGIRRPGTGGLDARPGDGEAVAVEPEAAHQLDVLGMAVVVVAGHRTRVAVADGAGAGSEGVPDRGAAAVLVHRSLDLVGGGGGTPAESCGQVETVRHDSLPGRKCEDCSCYWRFVGTPGGQRHRAAVRIRRRPKGVGRPYPGC